jgi:hypothetical protein
MDNNRVPGQRSNDEEEYVLVPRNLRRKTANLGFHQVNPIPPPDTNGWVTYAIWYNETSTISFLSTSWAVPASPSAFGAIVYIFNGIQSGGYLIQPVLQWENDSWSIACYFVNYSTILQVSESIPVTPGQVVIGQIARRKDRPPTGIHWLPQNTATYHGSTDLNFGSSVGPSIVQFGDYLYYAWKGAHNDNSIWWSYYNSDGSFAQQTAFAAGATSVGPSLVVFRNTLYMAWPGSGEEGIFWCYFDPENNTWSTEKLIVNEGASSKTVMAVFNNQLYMAWKGYGNDPGIWYSVWQPDSPGQPWAPQKKVPNVGTGIGPHIAVYGSYLYMAWKGTGYDDEIWWTTFDGTEWAAQQVVPSVGTSTGAALVVYQNQLYMAWKGAGFDGDIWWSQYINGNTWTAQQTVPGAGTTYGPELATYQGSLYMAWKGSGTDQKIWWTVTAGGSFGYICEFEGHPETKISIFSPLELKQTVEVLEVHDLNSLSQYPAVQKIPMQSIEITSVPTPTVTWVPINAITNYGQHTVVVSNSITDGEVDLYLTVQQQTPFDTVATPALAVYQNLLYMAWTDSVQNIMFSFYNGSEWAPETKVIAGVVVGSSNGPALAPYENFLYMTWKGAGYDSGIYWSRYNGSTWSPQQKVANIGTGVGPSMASIDGEMYMAWKGTGYDQGIWWTRWAASNWQSQPPQTKVPNVGTSFGPSLAFWNRTLLMAWKGTGNNQSIWWSYDGPNFVPQMLIPNVGSSQGPSVAQFGSAMYMAWNGTGTDQSIWWSSLAQEQGQWAPQQVVNGIGSSCHPALAAWNGLLYMVWKGAHDDQTIWWSSSDGKQWM